MFATLLGALPTPPSGEEAGDDDPIGAGIEAVIRAQESAGLEPITDGRLGDPDLSAWLERSWPRRTGSRRWNAGDVRRASRPRPSSRPCPGPLAVARTLGLRGAEIEGIADRLRAAADALAAAGCPLVEIEERDPNAVGDDGEAWRWFAEAHARLADGIEGTHLSLSIVGGSVPEAGRAAIVGRRTRASPST